MTGPVPNGFYLLSFDERTAYEADVKALGEAGETLSAARRSEVGPTCCRCNEHAPQIDAMGRCGFCSLTYFLRFAASADVADFVRVGSVSL